MEFLKTRQLEGEQFTDFVRDGLERWWTPDNRPIEKAVFIGPDYLNLFSDPEQYGKVPQGNLLENIHQEAQHQADYRTIYDFTHQGDFNKARTYLEQSKVGRWQLVKDLITFGVSFEKQSLKGQASFCLEKAQEEIVWQQDLDRWVDNRTSRPLVQLGNPWAKRVSQEVKTFTPELRQLAEDMHALNEQMNLYYQSSNKPSFLHANQLGSDLNLICMRWQKVPGQQAEYTFIANPKLTWFKDGQEISDSSVPQKKGWEGCYGFFEARVNVSRPMPEDGIVLQVTGLRLDGKPYQAEFFEANNKEAARLIQHEMDHGLGYFNLDRTTGSTDVQLNLLDYYREKYVGRADAEQSACKSADEAGRLVRFLKQVTGVFPGQTPI